MNRRMSATSLLAGALLLAGPPLVWQASLPAAQAGDTAALTSGPLDQPAPATGPDRGDLSAADDDAGAAAAPAAEPGVPVRVRAGAIGLDAPIDAVGLEDDGTMEIPDAVDRVGWYEPGVRPGQDGSAVLAGHVDSRTEGQGALFELRRLEPGDVLHLTDDAGAVQRFDVVARTTHPRDELPIDELFRWEGPRQLQIITCGGAFDPAAGGYADNVVITAVPVGPPVTTPDTRATTTRR